MADRFSILISSLLPCTYREAATELGMSIGSLHKVMYGQHKKCGLRVDTLMRIARYVKATPVQVLELLEAHEERFGRPRVLTPPWEGATPRKASAKRGCAPALDAPSPG